MKNLDIMVDIETLGKKDCVIIQIAAVAFDMSTGKIYSEFDQFINPKSCIAAGLKSDGDTVNWWLSQKTEVVNDVLVKAIKDGRDLQDVLNHFSNWVKKAKRDNNCSGVSLWCNGPSFDHVNLKSAYESVDVNYPIPYWSVQSVRTIVELGKRLLGKDLKKEICEKEGPASHHALEDVKLQVNYCSAIMKKLEKRK